MKLETIIPAVTAPAREGLELAVTRLDGLASEALTLEVGSGTAILEIGSQDGFFVFAHGKARLRSVGGPAGRAFVDAVADWLGLELLDGETDTTTAVPAQCSWVRLGEGPDALGTRWQGFKLFLDLGELHAEVFFRVSDDRKRAQLVEKWSEYRIPLVEILERTLTERPARRVGPKRAPAPASERMEFGLHGELHFEIPEGFRLTWQPEGHLRLVDEADEMTIELSALRLPPLPPEAPDVGGRLRHVIEGSEHAATAEPMTRFDRGDVSFAWTEYSFDSRDTKRPDLPPRPARGRWLVASNAWTQALVTASYWPADADRFARAWDELIASLRLAGRVVPVQEPRGET